MKYPGVDKVETKLVYRSMGREGASERLGMGFMHKPGVTVDEMDSEYPGYVLVYVIRGRGEYIDAKGVHYHLAPGSVFQRHPGVRHSTYIDPESEWAECFIELSRSLYQGLVALGIIRHNVHVYAIAPDLGIESALYFLMTKLEECSEMDLPEILVRMLEQLTRILRRCHGAAESEQASRMIELGLLYLGGQANSRVNLREFCLENGWGYEHFRKVFKNRIGMSPGRYRVRRRMDTACQLLRSSEKSISELAYELGYRSPYEFSAQFKREIGVSPSRFRASAG
jgi:AraC-like DNA-binding protein/quercetin dioxygenase-like cupin family protein